MSQVSVELLFPLSQAVDKKESLHAILKEEIAPAESVKSLLRKLAKRYSGFHTIFDADKQELKPGVWVLLNNSFVTIPEGLNTLLKNGDSLSLIPQYSGG